MPVTLRRLRHRGYPRPPGSPTPEIWGTARGGALAHWAHARPSADRTRARIQALATAGLDLPTFATAAVEVLRTALPFSAACVGTVDPATEIVTATVKWGGLTDGEDDQWAFHEYEAPDLYDFRDVMRRPGAVASTHHETDGDPHRSRRFTEFFHPTYGFDDELRAGCSADGITWGLFALFRDGPGSAFTVAEHEFVSSVSSAFAVGYRTALLTNAADPVVTAGVDGPGFSSSTRRVRWRRPTSPPPRTSTTWVAARSATIRCRSRCSRWSAPRAGSRSARSR
ncbi:hypothetical protein ACFQV8_30240 [Pseudonocardia benzenivorans]